MLPIATIFVIFIPIAPATTQDKTRGDVWVPVLRHHPGIFDTKERMKARDADEKVILDAVRSQVGSYSYGGGLGRGYVLSVSNEDLPRWKTAIDKLHTDGALKYYDRWGLDKNGCGLMPMPKR